MRKTRLIDADALKDKLQQHHDFYVMAWGGFSKMPISDKKRVDEITNCIAEVVNAPTIDAVSEWIPCSERLPEYRKLVLVTTRDLRVKPAYLDSIQDNGTDDWWSIPLDDADCALWNIVAWMPLPKPWKGADDE